MGKAELGEPNTRNMIMCKLTINKHEVISVSVYWHDINVPGRKLSQ
jgi:hypothetical protein